ncbi:precorrin-3B C(17)-methyltransferase [Streptomyces albus]|uniref:precorrin-3B C(17)-methyltransferase n=1 Tax=Streptomyces albus TaxID=1888 RepID=UPI001FC9EA4C
MTVRAVEVIAGADVVAYHSARHGRSIARSIAERHLRPGHIEERLVYPVTTETTDHPGGYRGALEEFYEEAAARLAAHLDAGRSVAVLAEGDPLFYGSYMHMHKRLADRYPTEVIPGVTSVSAAAARLGTPLVEGEEVLTILPGTLPEEELTARLASTDAAAVMKLGRTFPAVRRALERSGRLAEARYVERATMAAERTGPLAEVDPGSVPYFSVAVLPSRVGTRQRDTGAPAARVPVIAGTAAAGTVAESAVRTATAPAAATASDAAAAPADPESAAPPSAPGAAAAAPAPAEHAPATVPVTPATAQVPAVAATAAAPAPAVTPVTAAQAATAPDSAAAAATTPAALSVTTTPATAAAPAAAPPGAGEVVVVGLGPAGPLWLTPEARGELAAADDLVGYTTYLDRVPVRPGQRRHASDNKVESERAEFALDLARKGHRVAVVSSGDPGVFAMATAVLEVASEDPYREVPVRVLPGMTAAHAAAARAGAPLGHDYAVVSLSDRLKPWEVIAGRLRAAAAADLVLALYNPGSRSRIHQVGKARELLLEHRAPHTPVVVARDVGGPEESVRIVRLAELDPDQVDMRTILLVGSTQTRAVTRGDGREIVWTPRRYPDR